MGKLIHRIGRAVGRVSSSQGVRTDTESLSYYSLIKEKIILCQYPN
jgi:hypothetical protein